MGLGLYCCNMKQQTTSDEAEFENYDVDDVIGSQIKKSSLIGLGVAIDHKVVQNGRGEERYVFVCANEPGSSTTLRNVDDILEGLNSGSYELTEDPWANER